MRSGALRFRLGVHDKSQGALSVSVRWLRATSHVVMRHRSRGVRLAVLLGWSAAALSCHSPTEPDVADLAGTWENITNTNCNGARQAAVAVTQKGADFTAVDATLQAELSGHITGNTATLHVSWRGCGGSAEGSLSIENRRVTGSFAGTATGADPGCCGTVNGTLTWWKR